MNAGSSPPPAALTAPPFRRTFASSLRQRISLAVIGITSLVVAVNAVATWTICRELFINSVDRELKEFTKRIENDKGAHLPRRLGSWNSQRGKGGPRIEPHNLLEIIDSQGQVLFRSGSLGEDLTLAGGEETYAPVTVTLSDGRIIRRQSIQFASFPPERKPNGSTPVPPKERSPTSPPPTGPGTPALAPGETTAALSTTPVQSTEPASPITVRIGYDITRMTAELNLNALVLTGMWLGATFLAWLAVVLLRATILRPLNQLSNAIDLLGPNDLAIRLPINTGPDEVRGFVTKLNGLLDRLHEAFSREQATIANIAHELRTPVAALRTDLEFRLLAATDPAELQMLSACMGTVSHMQNQVSNLLLLARLESGREHLERMDLDVVDLLLDSLDRLRPAARTRAQVIATELPETVVWTTSHVHLSLLCENLLGNALTHGLTGGTITLSLVETSTGLTLSLTNPYTGTLNTEDLGKPYFRGDSARQDGTHCGLGLALCLRLSRLLGGTLTFTTSDQQFTACLQLPRATPGNLAS